jgi:hypothetical protein
VTERTDVKTVRFTQVVEACGRPQVHTLWLAPEKDRELKRARDAQRVMTLDHAGRKTDHGIVGFDAAAAKGGEVLIFPKSLRRFAGARVVGVKYDLIDQPKLASAGAAVWATPARAHPHSKPHAPAARLRAESSATDSAPADAAEASPPLRAPPAKPKRVRTAEAKSSPAPAASRLIAEIRAALKELERGKTVAAYRRLERAISH